MTLGDALHKTVHALRIHDIGDSQIEARILLGFVLNLSSVDIYTYTDRTLNERQIQKLNRVLIRRIRHEPTAYIVQHKEFYGLEFYVDNRVLIPRPETELIVEEALRFLTERTESITNTSGTTSIADIGTGCGALAVSIAVHFPHATIYATDISSDAIEVAQYNSKRHGVSERISFLQGDLLRPLKEPVDLLIANLPYVVSQELPDLNPEIKDYEPGTALDGGEDGLSIIKELFQQTQGHIKHDGCLILEIGDQQEQGIISLIDRYLHISTYDFMSDLNGLTRTVKVTMHN